MAEPIFLEACDCGERDCFTCQVAQADVIDLIDGDEEGVYPEGYDPEEDEPLLLTDVVEDDEPAAEVVLCGPDAYVSPPVVSIRRGDHPTEADVEDYLRTRDAQRQAGIVELFAEARAHCELDGEWDDTSFDDPAHESIVDALESCCE